MFSVFLIYVIMIKIFVMKFSASIICVKVPILEYKLVLLRLYYLNVVDASLFCIPLYISTSRVYFCRQFTHCQVVCQNRSPAVNTMCPHIIQYFEKVDSMQKNSYNYFISVLQSISSFNVHLWIFLHLMCTYTFIF